MKDIFPSNSARAAYNFLTTFLQKYYNIQKVKGKIRKDFFEIEFKYNSLEPRFCGHIIHEECFNKIILDFSPFGKYGDFGSYSLSGREINISNLKNLLKLCKLHDIPICKKCGKHPIKYFEKCIEKTTYSADLTGNPFIGKYEYQDWSPYYDNASFPVKLRAVCSCKNKWTLKGIITAHQIVDTSILDTELSPLIDRHPTKLLTHKEIADLLSVPTEYAVLENKKDHFKHILSKKEINQLIKAINAGDQDSNKILLPNQMQCDAFTIKRIFPKKDIKLLEELLTLYSRNKKHLRFWHRDEPELLFNSTEDYLNYLTKNKLFCYVLLISGKVIGCIEIGHLYIDAFSFKYRCITFWVDKNYTRKGIMFNALSALENTFRSQNIDYLLADVDPKNKPSKKLLEELHYYVNTQHAYMFDNGKTETFSIEFRKNLIDLPLPEAKEQKLSKEVK